MGVRFDGRDFLTDCEVPEENLLGKCAGILFFTVSMSL
jgi:hypothetical protein